MRTYVYIDGFNLYYGCIKGTPFRWLDLETLCNLLLPGHRVEKIRYFTAIVSARSFDPDKPTRQLLYHRALETKKCITIHLGHFLAHVTPMPLANPVAGLPGSVKVLKIEEKGSDVNLATHLLCDGFEDNYEVAVVVSNDSDLLEAIRYVRESLKKKVGLLNPHRHPSAVLLANSDFYKPIRKGVLSVSQLPAVLEDKNGCFSKPAAW